LGEFSDVQVDGSTLGVLIDGHTVVMMVSVWGKSYMPTLLKPLETDTPNTLPLNVIANEMSQVGLSVDVDVLCEGRRTSNDSYAEVYSACHPDLSARGRETHPCNRRVRTGPGRRGSREGVEHVGNQLQGRRRSGKKTVGRWRCPRRQRFRVRDRGL